MADIEKQLAQQVKAAVTGKKPLSIMGGNTKSDYGRKPSGEPLSVSQHQGVCSYEPTELVITARAGTPLAEIDHLLKQNRQMLAFEPPHFGPGATIGGTIACNFSGPRRPYCGAARDFLLGTKIINGKAEVLGFGGEMMKNVAGYDVSRLMCGAMGTLGVLLEISLKVLPRPASEITLYRETSAQQAIDLCNQWSGKPLPISASAWSDGKLYVRLSGSASAIAAAKLTIGGESLDHTDEFWSQLREHRSPFFSSEKPLWRLSVPPTCPTLPLEGETLIEWGGAQRWILSDAPADTIFQAATQAGGHATLFAGGERDQVFQPLEGGLSLLHGNLKKSFDPDNILNPGRMYKEF